MTVAATGGTRKAGSYTLIYGGSHNDLSYKASAGYQLEDGFMSRGKDALGVSRGNMELKYKINEDSDTYMDYYTPIIGGLNQTSWGNKQLKSETYLTFETGYQGKYLHNKLRPFVDIF